MRPLKEFTESKQDGDIDEEYREAREFGVDIVPVVNFVVGQITGTNTALLPVTYTPVTVRQEPRLDSIEIYQQMLSACGDARIEWARDRLRKRMGHLFDSLCPKTRSVLLGVEVDLWDAWHPNPSRAMAGLCAAFEVELRERFLERLARFVNGRGAGNRFPKNPKVKKPVIENLAPCEKVMLGDLLTAMRDPDPLWTDFFANAGLDQEAVRHAITLVKKQRNPFAHGASIGRQSVIEFRDDWLNPKDGIFAVLNRR